VRNYISNDLDKVEVKCKFFEDNKRGEICSRIPCIKWNNKVYRCNDTFEISWTTFIVYRNDFIEVKK